MKRKLNKSFLFGSLIGCVIGAACIAQTPSEKEIQMHHVRPNETLWGICQTFYNENDVDMYFLEFMYEVEQENKWLKDVNYRLQPNDVIKIPHKKNLRASGKSAEKI